MADPTRQLALLPDLPTLAAAAFRNHCSCVNG
jgi:hypothetical protein